MAFTKSRLETGALEGWAPVVHAAGIAGAVCLTLAAAHLLFSGHDMVAYVLLATGVGFVGSAILTRQKSRLGVTLLPAVALFGVFGMASLDGRLQSEALPWAPFAAMLVPACLRGAPMRAASLLVLTLPCLLLIGASPDSALWLRWLEVEGALVLAIGLALAFVRWRQESLSALQQEHSRLQLVIDNLPSGIVVADQDDFVVAANARLLTIFELREEELTGKCFSALLKERSEPKPSGPIEALMDSSKIDDLVSLGNRVFEVRRDTHGSTLALWSLHDVTHRVRSFATALGQLEKDDLTGLYKRGYLMRQLDEAILAEQRFALFFIDLDGFKAVNDRHGHAAGDMVLSSVASRLRAIVRKGDIACRLGGDEFCILAFGVQEAEQAGAIAEKIVAAIREPYDNLAVIGSSLGVPLYPDAAGSAAGLLECADIAMYASKRKGGNGWVVGRSHTDANTFSLA